MTTKDFGRLIFNREPTEPQRTSTNRTLLKLFRKEKLLNRIPYYDLTTERSGKEYVYGLSDKGMKKIDLWNIYDSDFAKTFDEHSERTLDHELEITRFHISLQKMCDKHGLRLFWQQCDLKKKTIDPDAYFAITDPTKPEGSGTLHYFLEFERAKFSGYRRYWDKYDKPLYNGQKVPTILPKLGDYYDYYNTDECEREWYGAFKKYRVITIMRNDEKRQTLLKYLHRFYDNRMFWLTTEEDAKHNIGSEIFKTPKDYMQRSYSFLTT